MGPAKTNGQHNVNPNRPSKKKQHQKNKSWGPQDQHPEGVSKFHPEQASSRCRRGCAHVEVGLDLVSAGRPFALEVVHLPCDQEANGVVLPNALVHVFAAPAVQHQRPKIIDKKLPTDLI